MAYQGCAVSGFAPTLRNRELRSTRTVTRGIGFESKLARLLQGPAFGAEEFVERSGLLLKSARITTT
jgi:hypothetical protein